MANLNMWKTVYQRNLKLFDKYYPEYVNLPEIKRSRYGLYLFILSSMFDIDDKAEFEKYIIDYDYNQIILGTAGNDNKIDLIYIDNDDAKIYIMNFKYREKYKEGKGFESTEIDSTINFLTLLEDEKYCKENLNNDKLAEYFEEIREIFANTSQIYDVYFYFISNEENGFSEELKSRLESIKREKGIHIEQITLGDLYNIGNEEYINTDANLFIETDKLSLFKNDNYSTNTSYIMNISLFELLRITCNNEQYRKDTNLKKDDNFDLKNFVQEKSQLRDNVRSYLGLTNYNKNIKETLKNDENNFFYYNNGITMVCNQINSKNIKTNNVYSIELNDIQIVNGGQTISTLFKIIEDNNIEDLLYKLKNTYILLRVFNISNDDELRLNIAQYTNSQNSIDNIDLKSVDKVQVDIENYLKTFGIDYLRKRSIVSENNESIKMIMLAQLIYAFKGFPDRATNQKKRLFSDYYDYIFVEDFDIDSCKRIYDLYKIIKSADLNLEFSEIYYIIYIISKRYTNFVELSENGIDWVTDEKISEICNKIRTIAEKFTESQGNAFAVSRAYIKKGFKEMVDEEEWDL
ncbi:MAG: AIPR family protein [Clostridia bacterium]|nr:AIPR family protein [Clostridia bacterium]